VQDARVHVDVGLKSKTVSEEDFQRSSNLKLVRDVRDAGGDSSGGEEVARLEQISELVGRLASLQLHADDDGGLAGLLELLVQVGG